MLTLSPWSNVEKLHMSSANWMDGIGRSWSLGGSQPVLKANIMSAVNRLKRSGERGSPCRSPTLDVKVGPSLAPSLMREVEFV